MSDAQTQTMPSKADHVDGAQFQQALDTATTPVLVDFYAEWCGPCKLAAPIIDKLAGEMNGKVKIVKLDVDASPETAQKFNVRSIPTVLIFNKVGSEMKEVDRKIGFPGEEGYRQMLAKVMG